MSYATISHLARSVVHLFKNMDNRGYDASTIEAANILYCMIDAAATKVYVAHPSMGTLKRLDKALVAGGWTGPSFGCNTESKKVGLFFS